MKKRGLTDSFNYAIQGLKYALKTQRNMRIHLAIGSAVIILGLIVGLSTIEFILLLSAVTLVIVAEMFNTALELAVDMFTKEFHHMAKLAKDIAAGCVFVTAVYAVIVGYLVFFRTVKIIDLSESISRIRRSPWHTTFIALVAVFSLVIIIKILLRKGTPLRGGWPSGAAATSAGRAGEAASASSAAASVVLRGMSMLLFRPGWRDFGANSTLLSVCPTITLIRHTWGRKPLSRLSEACHIR